MYGDSSSCQIWKVVCWSRNKCLFCKKCRFYNLTAVKSILIDITYIYQKINSHNYFDNKKIDFYHAN